MTRGQGIKHIMSRLIDIYTAKGIAFLSHNICGSNELSRLAYRLHDPAKPLASHAFLAPCRLFFVDRSVVVDRLLYSGNY
jgi:hypothetical protein